MVMKSFKNGFFHVGAHKTASSYLQNHLRKYRSELAKQDIAVLFNTGEFGKDFYKPYRRTISDAESTGSIDLNSSPCKKAQDAIITAFDNIKANNFIFSDERLLGPMIGYTNVLYPSVKYAAQFIKEISRNCANVEIILYIRSQVEFLESTYLQYVRENPGKMSVVEFKKAVDFNRLSWRPIVEAFAEQFEPQKVHVRAYEGIIVDAEAFVSGFFDIFSDIENISADEQKVNPKFSAKARDVFERAASVLDQQEAFKLQRVLKELFPVGDTYPAPEIFTTDEKGHLLSLYSSDTTQLLKDYP